MSCDCIYLFRYGTYFYPEYVIGISAFNCSEMVRLDFFHQFAVFNAYIYLNIEDIFQANTVRWNVA